MFLIRLLILFSFVLNFHPFVEHISTFWLHFFFISLSYFSMVPFPYLQSKHSIQKKLILHQIMVKRHTHLAHYIGLGFPYIPSISFTLSSGRGYLVDRFPAEKQHVPISSSVNRASIKASAYFGGSCARIPSRHTPFSCKKA